ncbi:hypothetical protein Tco_0168455 [Tanacetum coccineum]
MPNTRSGASMTHEEVEELVTRRVAEEMEAREAARTLEPLNENGDEQEGENGGNGNGGNGNGGNGGNGNRNGNHGMNLEVYAMLESCTCLRLIEVQATIISQELKACRIDPLFGRWRLWNVIDANPVRLQDAICIANQLMDKKQSPSRGKNTSGQNGGLELIWAENNERKGYAGPLPYYNKCRLHHEGLCTMRYGNCKKVGHQTRDCRAAIAPNTQRAPVGNQQDKKQDGKTILITGGKRSLQAKPYTISGGGTNPDSNVVTGTFLLNNCYASMLFDSGANRSFVSTTFSALLDVTPTTLDTSYVVELADGRILETNIYHVLIVCDEKVVRIPYRNEVLIIRGDNCDSGRAEYEAKTLVRMLSDYGKHSEIRYPQEKAKRKEASLEETNVNFHRGTVEIMDREVIESDAESYSIVKLRWELQERHSKRVVIAMHFFNFESEPYYELDSTSMEVLVDRQTVPTLTINLIGLQFNEGSAFPRLPKRITPSKGDTFNRPLSPT